MLCSSVCIVLQPWIKRLESSSGIRASAGCLKSKEELICSHSDAAQLAKRITFGVSEEPENLTYSWRQDTEERMNCCTEEIQTLSGLAGVSYSNTQGHTNHKAWDLEIVFSRLSRRAPRSFLPSCAARGMIQLPGSCECVATRQFSVLMGGSFQVAFLFFLFYTRSTLLTNCSP